jgi:hypothetical protein
MWRRAFEGEVGVAANRRRKSVWEGDALRRRGSDAGHGIEARAPTSGDLRW